MEFQLSYLKILKKLLLKCCAQYARKFGKLSSAHRTQKGQFSFQSQRRAMSKIITIALISHASKVMIKILQASLWQHRNQELSNIKIALRRGRGTRDQLLTSFGSQKKQGNSRKTSTYALLTVLKPLTGWIKTNCGKFLEMGIPDHLTCLLRNMYANQEATVRTRHETMNLFRIGKGVCQGCILSPYLYNFYVEYIM